MPSEGVKLTRDDACENDCPVEHLAVKTGGL